MNPKDRSRRLVWQLLVAVVLVAAFTGVAWDDSGGSSTYLPVDLAVGAGATALIYGSWWLVKRSLAASQRAFRRGYEEAMALESRQARRLGRWLGVMQARARRPEQREAMVRDAAGRAGRLVGSLRREFREGYRQSGQHR